MRIRWKMSIAGSVHNDPEGVTVGQVTDIQPDAEAERYIKLGYAELANQGRRSEEHAVQSFSNEERAVLDTDIVGASDKAVPQPRAPRPPKAESEPEPKSEEKPAESAKRGPGRPRKA